MRMILMLFVLCGTVLTADATHGAARDGSGWTAGAVAVFCCDFGHYPPVRNVQISYELCDVSIFADRRPHLRMLVPEKSRFRMEFSADEYVAGLYDTWAKSICRMASAGSTPFSVSTMNGTMRFMSSV